MNGAAAPLSLQGRILGLLGARLNAEMNFPPLFVSNKLFKVENAPAHQILEPRGCSSFVPEFSLEHHPWNA